MLEPSRTYSILVVEDDLLSRKPPERRLSAAAATLRRAKREGRDRVSRADIR